MSVLVQFKLEGVEAGKAAIQQFNKELAGTGTAAAETEKKVKPLTQSLDETSKKLSSVGASLTSVGKSLTIGLTLPIVAAGSALIKFAADATESENLFTVAMGDMEKEAREFSVELRKQLGLNEFEVRKQVGTFFQMTTAMGLSREAAFSMSTGLVTLTNDMASFFNLKPEEAFQKLQAGITGEVEPLKRLGIIINETTIQQAALNAGLIQQGQQMTEQQKVMARYLAIVDQTKNAQGDLARTLDSPTNQMRLLSAEINQQMVLLGTALLPVFSKFLNDAVKPAVAFVGDLVDAFRKLSPETQTLVVGFAALLAVLGPLLIALGAMAKATAILLGAQGLAGLIAFIGSATFTAALAAMRGMAVAVGAVTASFLAGYAAASLFINSITQFGKGSSGIINGVKSDFEALADTIAAPFQKIGETMNSIFASDSSGIGAAKQNVTDFAATIKSSMEQSAASIKENFGQAQASAKETEKVALSVQKNITEARQRGMAIEKRALEDVAELQEHFADREIKFIDDALKYDKRAQWERLQATRERFAAMGKDGQEAVNAVDRRMRELETQIRDRTFGGGAKQALDEYIDGVNDLGSAAKNIVGTAFRSLEGTISQFIQTGKLSFGDFVDSMKRALADFLASQIVKQFISFLVSLFGNAGAGSGGILSSIIGALGGGGGSGAAGAGGAGGAGSGILGAFGGGGGALASLGAGAAGFGLARALGLGGGTGGAIGGGIGGVAGAFVGGPIGAAIGSFLGSAVGGLFGGGKNYPYAKADISYDSSRGAYVGNAQELDGGPIGEVTALAQTVANEFNGLVRAIGIDPGNMTLSIGVGGGRPGSKLGSGFFAGVPGDFARGATHTGLPDAASAAAKALEYMINVSPDFAQALSAQTGMRAFATGGEAIFTEPTMIRVGESPERIRVDRLSTPGNSNGGVSVVIQGPNIFDDVSATRMASMINRAMQRRLNRGLT